MSYGEKIAFLRKRSGMTQAELGEKLTITYQAISKWERDESDPDFATMSKIAKIFNVPLSFFEEDVEATEDAINTSTASGLDADTLRQILEEHDAAQRERAERERLEREAAERERLERERLEREAAERERLEQERLEREAAERERLEQEAAERAWWESVRAERERAERERIEMQRKWEENARRAQEEEAANASKKGNRKATLTQTGNRNAKPAQNEKNPRETKPLSTEKDRLIQRRNRGLIASTFITLALIVVTLVVTLTDDSFSTADVWLATGATAFFMFPFIAQLFWDGFIVNVIFSGIKVVGTPGIIFDFSLDGLIFLIAMKILFAILRIVLMVLIFLFFLLIAIIISPFALVPQTIKLSLGHEL